MATRAEADRDDVIVGTIGKPFGTRGEVYVFADPDLDEDFAAGLRYATSRGDTLEVAHAQMHRSRLIVAFDGVADRQQAEALRGISLLRPRADILLSDGAVWVADLKGREVVDGDGELVGVVETVRDGHAHDFLLIARPDGTEVLVPLVEELVDMTADPIVITPPAGLIDPQGAW